LNRISHENPFYVAKNKYRKYQNKQTKIFTEYAGIARLGERQTEDLKDIIHAAMNSLSSLAFSNFKTLMLQLYSFAGSKFRGK